MNYLYKSFVIILLSALSLPALSKDMSMKMQSEQSAGSGVKKQGMSMGMGMSDEMKDKKARNEQTYILELNSLSDQIQDKKNYKNKQALMDQQLTLIKEHQAKKMMMKQKMMKKHMKMMDKKKSMKQ
jgi:hypothetical protein